MNSFTLNSKPMKKTNLFTQTTTRYLLGILFVIALVFSSCTKDEDAAPEPAPELPPEASFVMNFTDFTEADTTAYKSSDSYQNWGYSAANVLVWNVVLTVTLAVPVASFYEAFNHEGVFDPATDSWVWSYNFVANGVAHLAELHASLVDDGVKWEMYISKNNHYTDFLWYSGVSNLSNTNGYWELNKTPQTPSDFLYIEWNRDPVNGTADIKYTNIIQGNADNGSYIYYGVNEQLPYNRFYDIYSSSKDNITNIEWHNVNVEGRVRDELHFGHFDWNCWDANLLDTDCE